MGEKHASAADTMLAMQSINVGSEGHCRGLTEMCASCQGMCRVERSAATPSCDGVQDGMGRHSSHINAMERAAHVSILV
jgi:CDGSH-type Zn-finger protein